jgi:urease accessory protein
MTPPRLISLLHLCDSLFPTGAFAHSDGLEAATVDGTVRDAATLRAWMEACLEQTLERCEGPAMLSAWHAFAERRSTALHTLDADVHALRPSSTARRASRAMGTRLLKTWQHLYPEAGLARLVDADPPMLATLPIAFGIVSASAGIDPDAALTGFIYTRLAGIVSSAMRLMPIGQHEAHGALACILERVPGIVERLAAAAHEPRSFAPALDLAVMRQQYVHSRLFVS